MHKITVDNQLVGERPCLNIIAPVIIFLAGFYFVPLSLLEGLSLIPGDIGDARLNNYFLENIYQFLTGGSGSLWYLSFFYPFPFVGGFSDNLFGSSFAYIIPRVLVDNPDTAFQTWFLLGYVFNFMAAYWALRRLGGSVLAASVGALIFTFALPTTAHAAHAQLHYRVGLPLAIVFFADFLNTKTWRYFLVAGAWFVWQFYAGVYIGFFTLLLLVTMILAYLGYVLMKGRSALQKELGEFFSTWRAQSKSQKIIFIGILIFLVALLALLFYPYLQVSHLYGAKRSWSEISLMLPRPQSYFLSDPSFIWSNSGAAIFAELPMRHEHQMFIGLVPLILALVGVIVGSRSKNGLTFTLMTGMLGIAFVLTLYIGGFSLWYLLHALPLASAIRAMTRIDQAFLFPVAYLAVVAIDNFRNRNLSVFKAISFLVVLLIIAEAAMTTMHSSSKDSWRQRTSTLDAVVPKNLSHDTILFFAQRSGPWYADELDAMWVSMHHGNKTINGYSGLFPPGYEIGSSDGCAQLPKRILAYLRFSNQSDNHVAYRDLMSRTVPIGFKNCDPSWWQTPPDTSTMD